MSSQAISPEIEDHVAAVYDRTISVGKVLEVDDSDVYITFYQHSGNITGFTVFHMPKHSIEMWMWIMVYFLITYFVLTYFIFSRNQMIPNVEKDLMKW